MAQTSRSRPPRGGAPRSPSQPENLQVSPAASHAAGLTLWKALPKGPELVGTRPQKKALGAVPPAQDAVTHVPATRQLLPATLRTRNSRAGSQPTASRCRGWTPLTAVGAPIQSDVGARLRARARPVAAVSRWIHFRTATHAKVDARDLKQLSADWGACYQELAALPPGRERDAMAKRCADLAKAFEHSFRGTGRP